MKVVQKQTDAGRALDKALNDIQNNKKVVKVGWLKGAKYKSGTSVAYVATIQEYGDPGHGIPPRPMIRPTIAEQQTNWKSFVTRGAKDIVAGTKTASDVLKLIGEQAAGDLRETITRIDSPELKPATIKARVRKYKDKKTVGNLDKPLIDTGKLLNTVSFKVEKE